MLKFDNDNDRIRLNDILSEIIYLDKQEPLDSKTEDSYITKVYDIGSSDIFLAIEYEEDSYGSTDRINTIKFVKGTKKVIIEYVD